MKIETFKKRFDFPLIGLKGFLFAIIKGKNGKLYNVSINKKGEPIAKLCKTKLK